MKPILHLALGVFAPLGLLFFALPSAAAPECSVTWVAPYSVIFGPSIDQLGSRIGLQDSPSQAYVLDAATGSPLADVDGSCQQLSADGRTVLLASSFDLVPGGNPEGNQEIYLFDLATETYGQLTATVDDYHWCSLAISADGQRVVLRSQQDLDTGRNPDGNGELFLYDVATATFHQITDTVGGGLVIGTSPNVEPAISADGRYVVYVTDLVDGHWEIFRYDALSGATTRVTDVEPSYRSHGPSIDADGSRTAFISTADLVGQNVDGSWELYLYDIGPGSYTQLTDVAPGATMGFPVLSGEGDRLSITSGYDLETGQPLLGDVQDATYLWDEVDGRVRLSVGNSSHPATSLAGEHVAFWDAGVRLAFCPRAFFRDGFESGDLSSWSSP